MNAIVPAEVSSSPTSQTSSYINITVEIVCYVSILFVASMIRMVGLGFTPLAPSEAINAWSAWITTVNLQPLPFETSASSPLLFTFQTLLFWVVGGSDVAARLAPCILGIGMVLLPWWLRSLIGRPYALVLAFLIALDPWQVYFSRFADGAILTLFLFSFTMIALIHGGALDRRTQVIEIAYVSKEQLHWMRAAAATGGLFLISGHLAWSFLPLVVIFLILWRTQFFPILREHRWLIAWFGAAAIIGSAGGLLNPENTSLLSQSLSMWMTHFQTVRTYRGVELGNGPSPIWSPWLRLLIDQPVMLLFGLAGIYKATKALQGRGNKERLWFIYMVFWLGWAVILNLLPGSDPFDLLIIDIPLILTAAWIISKLLTTFPRGMDVRESSAVMITLIVLTISASFWTAALVNSPQFDTVVAGITPVLALLCFGVVILVAYAIWANRQHAQWVVGVYLAMVLIASSVSATWHLSHRNGTTSADGLFSITTHPDIRNLTQDIETISAQRVGDAYQIPVQVQLQFAARSGGAGRAANSMPEAVMDPVLAWYLRQMRNVEWVPSPNIVAGDFPMPIAVSYDFSQQDGVPDGSEQHLPADYIGSTYMIAQYWTPSLLFASSISPVNVTANTWLGRRIEDLRSRWNRTLQPFVKWVIYRERSISPPTENVVLWIRYTGD